MGKEKENKKKETVEELEGRQDILNGEGASWAVDDMHYEPQKPEQQEPKDMPEKGIVFNCLLLNVRKTADVDGKVVTRLKKGDRVTILETTDKFYKVATKGGITGFCMRDFISVY